MTTYENLDAKSLKCNVGLIIIISIILTATRTQAAECNLTV